MWALCIVGDTFSGSSDNTIKVKYLIILMHVFYAVTIHGTRYTGLGHRNMFQMC